MSPGSLKLQSARLHHERSRTNDAVDDVQCRDGPGLWNERKHRVRDCNDRNNNLLRNQMSLGSVEDWRDDERQDNADEDESLSDLFASLPVQETDPTTGKTANVINTSDGVKIYIRDFGKWTGVSPMRALEEACRSRLVGSNQVLTSARSSNIPV